MLGKLPLVTSQVLFGESPKIKILGGGFKHFLYSPRNLGKIPILTYIFQMG